MNHLTNHSHSKLSFRFLASMIGLCLLCMAPVVADAEEEQSLEKSTTVSRNWFRRTGKKRFDGLTAPATLNKKIKVRRPQRREKLPESSVALSDGKKVWVCGGCAWIRTTDKFSRESEKKLQNGSFRCPHCGNGDITKMSRTRSALQFKAISKNLIPNHSFERGRWWPSSWEPVDRLGTFWVKGGTDGKKCMKFNTNLLESQWLPYHSRIIQRIRKLQARTGGGAQKQKKNPLPAPPDPKPTSPPYYDTVAGLHGIHYKGPFIPVQPGAIYRITVDAKVSQKGGAKVFVKGFVDRPYKTRRGLMVIKRNAYRAPMNLDGLSQNWKRFSRVFHPARSQSTIDDQPVQPEWLRVQLYSYWPPGTYWWDNVKLEIIGYEKLPERGASARDEGQQQDKPKMKGGFPVF